MPSLSPPRVLYLIQRFRPVYTGAGIQIDKIAADLAGRGAQVLVAAGRAPGTLAAEDGLVPVRRFRFVSVKNPVALWWATREFLGFLGDNRDRFDILHVIGAPAVLPVVLPRVRSLGWGTVITSTLLRADDPLTLATRGRMAWWRMREYRQADRFIGFCPAQVDTYPPAGIDASRVHHIPNGVNMESFAPAEDRDAAAAELGWAADKPRALFSGAWLHRKGVDVLLDAWERVVAEVPGAQLYMAGPTEMPGTEPGLERFSEEHQARARSGVLAGQVHVLGNRGDIDRLYRAAHVFVFPSRMEGFPNVVLESLASGTPPVVTRIAGSTDESVRDGETGYVVEQEDAVALADRVIALLRDAELRERMSKAARADAEKRYALRVVADAHWELYEAVRREKGRG